MKKLLNLALVALVALVSLNCEMDDSANLNYVTFENDSRPFLVDVGGTTTENIKVYTGNITGSDRTFNISVDTLSTLDASAYVVPQSVTVPAGVNVADITVEVSDTMIGAAGETLILAFEETVETPTSPALVLNVSLVCPNAESVIAFQFDGYADETTWDVKDENGTIVSQGGGYANGQASASTTACLLAGETYTFTVNDSYGDGLSFPEDGTASITYEGVVLSSVTGDFGFQFVDTFTVPN